MDRRRSQRSKKRMGCTLWVEGGRYAGIVLDLSATGLFVQTSANAPPGTEVRIDLNASTGSEPIVLLARVARRKVVPARLKSVAQGGIGVRIGQAPEAYFALLARTQRLETEASGREKTRPAKSGSGDPEKKALRSHDAGVEGPIGAGRKGAAPKPGAPEGSATGGPRRKSERPGSRLKRKALAAALRSSLGVDIERGPKRRK